MSKRNPERVALNRLKHWLAGRKGYRIMYDDYSGNTIPSGAVMVAGYGWWAQSQWDRFRGKPEILIATNAGENFGDVLDVENGDASPGQTEGWISMRKVAGYYRPTIYCNASTVPAVRIGTGKYVLGRDYDLWVADWKGYPFQYPGAVATQYANVGTLYDLSAVYDSEWPHRKDKNPPKPKPKGPFKRVASGSYSLAELATARHTTQVYLADLVMRHGTDKEREALVNFIIRFGVNTKIPKGTVLYTYHSGGAI